jgi:hypothetical protein
MSSGDFIQFINLHTPPCNTKQGSAHSGGSIVLFTQSIGNISPDAAESKPEKSGHEGRSLLFLRSVLPESDLCSTFNRAVHKK